MNKPKVGQTLYSLNVGNAARNCEQKLTPVIVTSVGNKYFYTGEGYRKQAYLIEDWKEKTDRYGAMTMLYESEQAYRDDIEAVQICKAIGKAFEYGRNVNGLPLYQLRTIQSIINQGN